MAVVAGFETAEESTLDTFVDIVQNCRTHSNRSREFAQKTLKTSLTIIVLLDVEALAREASERAIRRGCIYASMHPTQHNNIDNSNTNRQHQQQQKSIQSQKCLPLHAVYVFLLCVFLNEQEIIIVHSKT